MVLDSLGNILIDKGAGTGAQYFGDALTQIIQTKDQNFIAVGGVDYPPINGRSFLAKFDKNADIIFIKEYDTINYQNSFMRVEELNDSTILTGGCFDTENKYTNGFNNVIRIMKLDKNGNFIWKKYFDNYTDNSNQDFLAGMCLTSSGDIAFTSFTEFQESTPLTFMFYRTDTSYCDANAVACYKVTWISETEKLIGESYLMLYPNPATNECIIKLKTNDQVYIENIEIRTLLGQLVHSQKDLNQKEYTLNTLSYRSGVYYISLETSTHSFIEQKLIIIK